MSTYMLIGGAVHRTGPQDGAFVVLALFCGRPRISKRVGSFEEFDVALDLGNGAFGVPTLLREDCVEVTDVSTMLPNDRFLMVPIEYETK
jgi:hypothetical protein